MSEKLRIDWARYLTDIHKLVDKIRLSGSVVTSVYGVEPGGKIPATVLSQQLDLPFLCLHQLMAEFQAGGGNVLVVDSVLGGGESLLQFQEYDSCLVAVLYKRKCPTLVYPKIIVHEVSEDWIVLPYERDVSSPVTMPTSSRGE